MDNLLHNDVDRIYIGHVYWLDRYRHDMFAYFRPYCNRTGIRSTVVPNDRCHKHANSVLNSTVRICNILPQGCRAGDYSGGTLSERACIYRPSTIGPSDVYYIPGDHNLAAESGRALTQASFDYERKSRRWFRLRELSRLLKGRGKSWCFILKMGYLLFCRAKVKHRDFGEGRQW